MTIHFDMHRIGRTIAHHRRELNMTQMQLADEMGVSFQAVSNWERGQSMPDISKLPELAELFSTTIDELLGCSSSVISAAATGKLAEIPITPEALAEAAPLLTPEQVDVVAERLTSLSEADVPLASLLPFLHEEKVNQIARSRTEKGQDICDLLPFMTEDTIDEMARSRTEKGQDICDLLPFMTEDTIDEMALALLLKHQPIDSMTPFVSERLLDRLADLLSTKD